MKNNKKKKLKMNGVRIMCWILAGLMVIGTVALLISAFL